jgi:Na+/H+ antiporter NhaD/arsenite permease-like protein
VSHAAFVPAPIWVVPFVVLLVCIAVLPLALPHFWQSNLRKLAVSVLLGGPVVWLYWQHNLHTLHHAFHDYVSFIILLGSLFVISSGVRVEGDLKATPAVNTGMLAVGAVLASIIGTTGASMLLIHPLLDTNSERTHVVHTVVFFIFLVSNIGGCLTPLGDPPLFLGFLQGVPFTWTLRLAPAWLMTVSILLAVYFLWDRRAYATESVAGRRADDAGVRPVTVAGKQNLVFLAGIVGAAALVPSPWRELAMLTLAALSLWQTQTVLRAANHFSYHPLLEVAAVFIGIFTTMIPALDLLRVHGADLGVREPWQFFWATGLLSSALDNAPTYLAFLALGQGQHLGADVVGVTHQTLQAISLGAVFMGANTYIGNGPNFMVRSIAESRGVRMPGFLGYMVFSGAVLLPVFGIITVVFFR